MLEDCHNDWPDRADQSALGAINRPLSDATVIAGRYRLLQALRRGGMSEVFLAFDEQAQQEVAVKLVANNTPEYGRRLQREVAILRALCHPHILPLLDDGCAGAYCYLVMPYMRTGNLRERLARKRMTPQEAGNVLMQLAEALQYAHKQGIVHRDIKPSNVLLDTADEDYVYLADFGLAKALDVESDITQTGCLIGTPQYMAPELADMPYSIGSDIYALGIMLYQMLTGRLPFSGTDPLAICWKHMQEQPQPPSILNPHISQSVEQVILRALDKKPERRFADAQAMTLAYTNALMVRDKQHVLPLPVTLSLPAIQVALCKKAEGRAVVSKASRWLYASRKARRKITISLSILVLMALPLSLGLLLGREFNHINTPLLHSDRVLGNTIASSSISQGEPALARDTNATQHPGKTIDADDVLPQDTPERGPTYTSTPPPEETVVTPSTPTKATPKPGHRLHAGKGRRRHAYGPHGTKKLPKGRKRGQKE